MEVDQAADVMGAGQQTLEEMENYELREIMKSQEWQEADNLNTRIEKFKEHMSLQAKEIAQQRGFTTEQCDSIQIATIYVAEQNEDKNNKKNEITRLVALARQMGKKDSKFWNEVKKEVNKSRSWENPGWDSNF